MCHLLRVFATVSISEAALLGISISYLAYYLMRIHFQYCSFLNERVFHYHSTAINERERKSKKREKVRTDRDMKVTRK